MKLPLLTICFLVTTCGAISGVRAQPAGLDSLISGKDIPLSLKLSDLTGEWRRVRLVSAGDTGGSWLRLVMGGGGSHDVYYTRGQSAVVGSETYLLAYQVRPPPVDMMAMMRGQPNPMPAPPFTPETQLFLALLNQRTMGSLTDIRPFDLKQEVAEQAVAAGGTAETRSMSNLKQLGLGFMQYVQDYDNKLPPLQDAAAMKAAVLPYVKNEKVFISPIDQKPYLPNPLLSKKNLGDLPKPFLEILLFEGAPSPAGTRAVLFADGHVKRYTEAEWADLKAKAKIP